MNGLRKPFPAVKNVLAAILLTVENSSDFRVAAGKKACLAEMEFFFGQSPRKVFCRGHNDCQ